MIKILNSPSINQGIQFKKYQTNIGINLEKKAKDLKSANLLETFTNNNSNNNIDSKSLIEQTNYIIDANNYETQSTNINNLRQEYNNALNEYKSLISNIQDNINDYVSNIKSTNPYLNSVIQFESGYKCYVTLKGVVKYIPSKDILNSLNLSTQIINVNLPWKHEYSIPGNYIPTRPPMISGDPMEFGESVGLANINKEQEIQLQQIQVKMKQLLSQIVFLTEKFKFGTAEATIQSEENIFGINKYLSVLNNINKKMVSLTSYNNDQNILNDSSIIVLQKNYEYIFWTILASVLIITTFVIYKKQ